MGIIMNLPPEAILRMDGDETCEKRVVISAVMHCLPICHLESCVQAFSVHQEALISFNSRGLEHRGTSYVIWLRNGKFMDHEASLMQRHEFS